MEERFRQITHKGETIVVLDLSNLQDEKEIIRLLKMRSTLQSPIVFSSISPTLITRGQS